MGFNAAKADQNRKNAEQKPAGLAAAALWLAGLNVFE
jgi:hypothetical protein